MKHQKYDECDEGKDCGSQNRNKKTQAVDANTTERIWIVSHNSLPNIYLKAVRLGCLLYYMKRNLECEFEKSLNLEIKCWILSGVCVNIVQ